MASHPTLAPGRGSHGPRPHAPLLAGVAIVLAILVVAGAALAGIYIRALRASPAPQPTTSATAGPLAGFGSGPYAGGTAFSGQLTSVGAVHSAAQTGYDRFVIDLGQSPLQQYEVRTQSTSTFTLDPKGEVVTLDGTRGVLVILSSASNHDAFTGSTDVQPGLPAIREARLIGDYEGVVSWGIGVDGPGFVRVTTLTDPDRLVVDVQT